MTYEEIREMFIYEPETGMLRKVKNCRKPYPFSGIGKDARYLATRIYVKGKSKTFYLHRLVWMWHKGCWPERIDHIDGDPRNNRIDNLRECTTAQNQYNSKRKVNNRSGAKGVVFHKNCPRKPWQAKIVVNKKIISLGYFATVEEAAEAYRVAALKYAKEFAKPDYTPNANRW